MYVKHTLARRTLAALAITASLGGGLATLTALAGDLAATHVYHNHMPNFWPYFDSSTYNGLAVGNPVRYTYDGYVIELKESPPANYTYYLPNGSPMPHDDLVSYYSHHAKQGAYMSWPMDTAIGNSGRYPKSQTQVTMSGAVINNVQSLNTLQNVSGYTNPSWGQYWKSTYDTYKTTSGYRALEPVHFTGHHSMGPLVGPAYFLKDLIYHNATLAQSYFLGGSFKSSKGFFPTELGFSERLIPTLKKLGIEWSVAANVHFSRTLKDYPYLNDPGIDTMVSPPNRADLQNTSSIGEWKSIQMFNEQQVTQNKFPFASIPHWTQYVDPNTAVVSKLATIPVEQASSWEEGYQGSVTSNVIKPYSDEAASLGRKQYFVIAHDGDNSSGRAGDGGTWANSGNVTYADAAVEALGVEEYLKTYPIPANDIVHIQDGSWIDTRDSSADPTWYHWHLPFGIWQGQFSDFNTVNGTDYAPKTNFRGEVEGMTVSLEYGYHYLERNFALLQAAENYARTAEQIWLDNHPSHWQPTSAMDGQVTYTGNQLNPWMMSYPVKGNPSADYANGANPAELAWYFLVAALDSGFGYYDENQDDHLKPTIAFNESLDFSKPYVQARLAEDKIGPSVWWPQRWPYNPGSANKSKAEGWTLHYFDTTFAIYTYAYDLNGIQTITLKVRTHTSNSIDPLDKTCRVYNPSAFPSDPKVNPSLVSAWTSYPMVQRDLTPDINGVDWQASTQETMAIVPAREIGDLYYTYLDQYQDQTLDYYIEATDSLGNITRSEIQQVYVGQGRFTTGSDGKIIESATGEMLGTYPFVTDQPPMEPITLYIEASKAGLTTVTVQSHLPGETTWVSQTVPNLDGSGRYFRTALEYPSDGTGLMVRYTENGSTYVPSSTGILVTTGTWTLSSTGQLTQGAPAGLEYRAKVYYYTPYGTSTYMHYAPNGGAWTTVPGVKMSASEYTGYTVLEVSLGTATGMEAVFTNGSGSWDNNGGKNYDFPAGTSTLKSGTITSGAPAGTPGNIPPVANAGPDQTVNIGQAVTLTGSGTDADGTIVSYAWSNGATTASQTLTYPTAGTNTLTLTVKDNGGASATDSVTITVVDPNVPTVTVYYKQGYTTPYIHYKQASGVWTTAPGVAMPLSEFTGYNVAEAIPIGTLPDLECVFTNGSGSWDNNGGKNYHIPAGVWTFDAGKLTEGAPGVPNQAPTAVVEPARLTLTVDEPFTLSGAASTDPDGDPVSYLWSTGETTQSITLSLSTLGVTMITLTVTDPEGLSSSAVAEITVEEAPAQGCGTQRQLSSTLPTLGATGVFLLPILFFRRRRARRL